VSPPRANHKGLREDRGRSRDAQGALRRRMRGWQRLARAARPGQFLAREGASWLPQAGPPGGSPAGRNGCPWWRPSASRPPRKSVYAGTADRRRLPDQPPAMTSREAGAHEQDQAARRDRGGDHLTRGHGCGGTSAGGGRRRPRADHSGEDPRPRSWRARTQTRSWPARGPCTWPASAAGRCR
jgi:hypothetical protein